MIAADFDAIIDNLPADHNGKLTFTFSNGTHVSGEWTYLDNYLNVIVIETREQIGHGIKIKRTRTFVAVADVVSIAE